MKAVWCEPVCRSMPALLPPTLVYEKFHIKYRPIIVMGARPTNTLHTNIILKIP